VDGAPCREQIGLSERVIFPQIIIQPKTLNRMKHWLLIGLLLTSFKGIAQKPFDTVVVRQDSTFESFFHRKLYDHRTNLKYHLEDRGNVRELRVFLAVLEELVSGKKMYAVRIDERGNRNLFTDAPVGNAEYIDEDELPTFIGYLRKVRNEVMNTDHASQQYTEYRFYTRAGIMLECYTGLTRWRCVIHYELNKMPVDSYINNPERLRELIETLEFIEKEIKERRQKVDVK
jgi:hypothetical protein